MSMSEISAAATAATTAAHVVTQQAASVKLLEKSLSMQADAMSQLLASMGLGQNIDIEA